MTSTPRITHETVDVHEPNGELRNRLEQMSVPRGSEHPSGWEYLHGWTRKSDGQPFDLYVRELGL